MGHNEAISLNLGTMLRDELLQANNLVGNLVDKCRYSLVSTEAGLDKLCYAMSLYRLTMYAIDRVLIKYFLYCINVFGAHF